MSAFFIREEEELRLYEEDEYDELDFRADDQYWMSDRKLQIEDVKTFSSNANTDKRREFDDASISSEQRFAINKLKRYVRFQVSK